MKKLTFLYSLACLTLTFMAFSWAGPHSLTTSSAQAASALAVSGTGGTRAEEPQDLPAILQQAIDRRDSDAAAARLDFERITEDFFQTALPQINAAVASGTITLPQSLSMLLVSLGSDSLGSGQAMQAFFSSEVRKFTLYGIASGCFAGRPLPPEERAGLDGGLFLSFGNISTARKEFAPGKLLGRQDASALIQTTLFDHGSRQRYDLKMALELRAGRWVAVGIANTAELTEVLLKEAR